MNLELNGMIEMKEEEMIILNGGGRLGKASAIAGAIGAAVLTFSTSGASAPALALSVLNVIAAFGY